MLNLETMELLPIIIIVSLLGFFILLTLVLFTWQLLRARDRRKKRYSNESEHLDKPIRKLTLQSGKAIPTSQKQDTASTRDPYSLDLTTPLPTFSSPSYTVTCEAKPRAPKHRPLISAQDHGHPTILADLEAQAHKQDTERPKRAVSEPNRPKEKITPPRVYSIPAKLMSDSSGSLTVPRPALVTIESRRPSAARSYESHARRTSVPKVKESQSRRSSASRGQEITSSLQRAYQGPSVPGGPTHELPASPALLTTSMHTASSQRTSEARPWGDASESPAVSSRVVSDSIQRPPPLFSGVSYSPRVRFAPPTQIDYNRVSFLSMTDSASSSVASGQVSPISPMLPSMRVPPPSTVELPRYELSPPPSERASPARIRNTPPHLETPDFGRTSFFDSGKTSPEKPKSLTRGVSVMSNRSNFTIASSEISSSNWTFGNAKVVNIYPSIAQEERHTPPYATKLRSKYGQYPRGRRNKALPVAPKSPLWQSEFGPVEAA